MTRNHRIFRAWYMSINATRALMRARKARSNAKCAIARWCWDARVTGAELACDRAHDRVIAAYDDRRGVTP